MDEIVTVCGWALNAKLQQNDSLLFVSLVDGSNSVPLQVVIENSIPGWQDVKKTKRGYSFRLTGKILKSPGKGQTI